jgi:hypothetical protein
MRLGGYEECVLDSLYVADRWVNIRMLYQIWSISTYLGGHLTADQYAFCSQIQRSVRRATKSLHRKGLVELHYKPNRLSNRQTVQEVKINEKGKNYVEEHGAPSQLVRNEFLQDLDNPVKPPHMRRII